MSKGIEYEEEEVLKNLRIFILTLGVFSIINTEMGVIGILPMIADHYQVSITTAGLLVSMFALAVAVAGPTMPLLFSGMNRKHAMVMVLSVFTICNVISAFSLNFTITLIARVLPAFFHPVYVSLAFSVASGSVEPEKAPQAVSKVMTGVSAGMVLGVPIVSFIANLTSLMIAMIFFAVVNAVALLITILFIPSSPVEHKLSYGEQLMVLKESNTWISIIGVMLLNGAIFGVYSYISQYLTSVTDMTTGTISIILFIYGMANILGNAIAGKMLSRKPIRFILISFIGLTCLYIIQTILGDISLATTVIIFIWGILAGCVGNINQYWMSTAVPHAPDFANGLFLAATNLGTTVGTTLCGVVITSIGISSIFIGGLAMLILSLGFILTRIYMKTKVVEA